MKMTAAHSTGGGLGAVAAIVIIGLGKRAGVTLTNEDAVALFGAATTAGIGVGHGIHRLLLVGIIPSWRTLWWGPDTKK